MPAMTCPHCGSYANLTMRWVSEIDPEAPTFRPSPSYGCATCDYCGKPVVAELIGLTTDFSEYWPRRAWGKDFPDVPLPVAGTANEAHICLSAGSPRGAAALARAVVESVAKHKGITKGNLQSKIDALHTGGHISEAMLEAAHEIRFAGNEVAHGDVVSEPLDPENAEAIVRLMDTILARVFQEPAEVGRIRQRRETRRSDNLPSITETASDMPF